jgi:hypothetical protein
MARITGIGGVFFKSTGDHKKLSEWYASNLGLQLEEPAPRDSYLMSPTTPTIVFGPLRAPRASSAPIRICRPTGVCAGKNCRRTDSPDAGWTPARAAPSSLGEG